MVKKLLLVFAMLLVLFTSSTAKADPNDSGFTTWLMGDYNQTGVRVGYQFGRSFELFGSSYWWLWEQEDIPQVYGLGVIYHIPGEIDISNIPIFGQLSDHISIASYIGFQGAIELRNDEEERGYLGPLAGIVLQKFLFDEVDDEISTGTEIQLVRYTDQLEESIRQDEVRVSFYLRIKY